MLQLRAYSIPAVPDAGHRRTRSDTENPQVLRFQTYITYFIAEIFVTFPSASPVLFSTPCAASFPEKAPTPSDCSRSLRQSIPLQLPEASDRLRVLRYPEAAFLIPKPEHRSVLRLQNSAQLHYHRLCQVVILKGFSLPGRFCLYSSGTVNADIFAVRYSQARR